MRGSFGSIFSGIGGADLGFEAAGLTSTWQIENDPACLSVLRRHWPNVPKHLDVHDVSGADLDPVDVVVFGSPCQDLSIAAPHRAGLDGDRSHTFYEALRIIQEMRDVHIEFPKWIVWENVTGALSSNGGSDFGHVLDSLAHLGALVIEWAVLDAQFFGVPQRRRRVFLVACLDPSAASRCPDPLLPLSRDRPSDPVQSGAPGSDDDGATPNLARRVFVKSTRARSNTTADVWREADVAPTLNTFDRGHSRSTVIVVEEDLSPRTLTLVEMERLMGWPDDFTRFRDDGREQSPTARHKQIGNGVAAPVAEWVARQIMNA